MVKTGSRLWLPFTQMQSFDASERTFVRGEGTMLIDDRGRRVFDAVSSIWTIVHGHCHKAIVRAISEQAQTLDHATTLGATNPVAETLASRLCALTGMDHAFFASDGASAIEAALKMALQYWQQSGQGQRTRFVRLIDAYHGDTAGAMSVSDIAVFKSRFGALTFETIPYDDVSILRADDIAAIILEPVVQAAAGMRLVPRERYEMLAGITPLLIVDEIATGFGRTGTMFAFEQLGLRPDLLCLGKGMTGGTLALSATLATERIFDAFLGEKSDAKQFFHGHSYAGNPIACAAALASLDLFDKERTLENVEKLTRTIRELLRRLNGNESIVETRQAGTMTGIELRSAQEANDVTQALYERGHFTRAIGATVQLVPPLSSTTLNIRSFFDALEATLH